MGIEKVMNMNKVIKVFSLIVSVLSLIFILYGSIKLVRVEEAMVSQNIDSGIPGIEIVQPSNVITGEDAQRIVSLSVASLIVGVGGYFISSRIANNNTVTSDKKDENISQSNTTLDETDQNSLE